MSRYLCHVEPELLEFEAEVVGVQPGAVLLDRSAFYPGGGGQLPDRGRLVWKGGAATVTAVFEEGGRFWHRITGGEPPLGGVRAEIDREFRATMRQLHTDLHILNALVYREFNGALVTGAQIGDDRTARVDFDLPDADNERLRGLEREVNDVIRSGLRVRDYYASEAEVRAEPALLRSRSVAPPPLPDGTVRIVEIADLDRQACGGTHLTSTAESAPIRILKVDNKGRHNRRVRIGLI